VNASGPKISPDRRKILFVCGPRGTSVDFGAVGLWQFRWIATLRAPFTRHRRLDPSRSSGVVARRQAHRHHGLRPNASGYRTLRLDSRGRSPVRVTCWHSVTTDVSWFADGQRFLTNSCGDVDVGCAPAQYEIFSLSLDGGARTRLTHDGVADYDPYASPDGTKIAWLRKSLPDANRGLGAWGVWMTDADGKNPHAVIDDGNVNSKPDWSPDGTTIDFHRLVFPLTRSFGIWSIHPDGSGLTELTEGQQGASEYPDN